MAEMIAFPLLFLLSLLFFRSLVASLLPVMIGVLAIVGTFLILRVASEFGSISIFALNLTTGAGPGAGDRLQPLHRLPLPRGDRQGRARAGGDAAGDGDRRAHRLLLLADGGGGAGLAARLPPALPLLDGAGRRPGGAARRALVSLTVLPAVLTLLGRRVNSLAPRFLQRRAEADARPDEHGFWYRLSRFVMRRPLPIATLQCPLPDRARPALPRHQVQHRRPQRPAGGGERPPGLRHGQRASSRPTARRRSGSRSRAAGRKARSGSRRRSAGPRASPRSSRRSPSKAA